MVSRLSGCFGFVVGLVVFALAAVGVGPASASLRYSSAGHAVAFERDGFLTSNGAYALRVSFEGGGAGEPAAHSGEARDGSNGLGAPFEGVSYTGVWPGIDVVYDAPAGGIARSTWTVAPGADPTHIRLRYNRDVALDATGSLEIVFQTGRMVESAPIAWQEIEGERAPVEVSFAHLEGDLVGFSVGEYRRDLPLVIDPTLEWMTFLGGLGNDIGTAIAVDAVGNSYVVGFSSQSWGAPVRPFAAGEDGFVAKLDPTGLLLWNTLLGAGEMDRVQGVALGASGEVYVVGSSEAAWGTPILDYKGDWDAFVAEVDPDSGALVWHTFLGGFGREYGSGIAIGAAGSIHVAGWSESSWGSPVLSNSGNTDAFVATLSDTGGLICNTFLGGGNFDGAEGIATSPDGRVFVTGASQGSWGSPIRNFKKGYDAFVAEVDTACGLVWNTFLGGNGEDWGYGITADNAGYSYVVGQSDTSWGVPARPYTGGFDAFASSLDPSGNLEWNTFLGGSGYEEASDAAIDASGSLYVSGVSGASWGTPVDAYDANEDAVVARLDPSSGALRWHTFLGGSADDWATGVTTDASGDVYLAGLSRAAWGTPVRAHTAASDAFAARLIGVGCGDADITGSETCDDGNLSSGDGCSATCEEETGWDCSSGTCSTICGDSIEVGAETCDDGNVASGDGCSALCLIEAAVTPTLLWNTFAGDEGPDSATAIAVDDLGNSYVVGTSNPGWGTPVRAYLGKEDVFVAKFDPEGVLSWVTFLGDRGSDNAVGVALGVDGELYVTGWSDRSWGDPVRAHVGGPDTFVARLDTVTGRLDWSTFLGGNGDERSNGIAVGAADGVFVIGNAFQVWNDEEVPALRGFTQSLWGGREFWVAKLAKETGELLWYRFDGNSRDEAARSVTVDGTGSILVTGQSQGPAWVDGGVQVPQPHSGGSGLDAFVIKYEPSGQVSWLSFFGDSASVSGQGIAVDALGAVYVVGEGEDWGAPLQPHSGGLDAFATKLTNAGVSQWHTFLGGNSSDGAVAVTVDGDSNVYIGGFSETSWGVPLRAHSGISQDGFVAMLGANGDLSWNLFLGAQTGVGSAASDRVSGIGVDFVRNVYVAGESGFLWGTPVREYAGGASDGFAAMIRQSLCGNSVMEAAETCDDGDAAEGDGCSILCGQEPGWDCSSGTCEEVCGDGTVVGQEICDDGNLSDADCCSSACIVVPGSPDADSDGFCDSADNCPSVCNPDQLDSDLDANGGDACDACPAVDQDAPLHCTEGQPCCDASLSASTSVSNQGPACGAPGPTTLSAPGGEIDLTLPAGAVAAVTTVSVTGGEGEQSGVFLQTGEGAVFGGRFEPEGLSFLTPATLTFTWPDSDDDGLVDGIGLSESELKVLRKGDPDDPFGAEEEIGPRCGDVLCESIDAGSGIPVGAGWGAGADPDGNGLRTCCDPTGNRYFAEVSNFSAYALSQTNCPPAQKTLVKLLKLDGPAGTHKLLVKGQVTVDYPFDPAIDPTADGMRIEIRDAKGAAVLQAAIPGGAYDRSAKSGWKANGAGTTYTWKSSEAVEGLFKALLKWGSGKSPGTIKFKVIGKDGDYGVSAEDLPLWVQVRTDTKEALTNQCGQLEFDQGPSGPICETKGSGGVFCR